MKRFLQDKAVRSKLMRHRLIRWGSLCFAIFCCCGCGKDGDVSSQSKSLQSIDTAMGTIIQQTIYTEDANSNAISDILSEITDLEEEELSWRLETSEIYAVNAESGEERGTKLSGRLTDILEQCLEVSRASEGAFDVTMGDVVRLWDIDAWAGAEDFSDYELPSAEQINAALQDTGYEKLTLQEDVLYLPSGLQLDLGAVGKGIALTEVQEYLEGQENITGAVISVGGSILTYGGKPDGTSWKVGIVNPADTSANLGYLSLDGQWCVSTSGDYERYVEVDGTRYHHIIDPADGYPADSGLGSVTILTKGGLLSDALSTACFVLGREEGSRLAEEFEAEALFVDHEGNIFMTDGMEQYFHLSK